MNYKTYFETFCSANIQRELKAILKIGRNPLNRKKLSKEEREEIKKLIKTVGSELK